jgi:hypothetical protein
MRVWASSFFYRTNDDWVSSPLFIVTLCCPRKAVAYVGLANNVSVIIIHVANNMQVDIYLRKESEGDTTYSASTVHSQAFTNVPFLKQSQHN